MTQVHFVLYPNWSQGRVRFATAALVLFRYDRKCPRRLVDQGEETYQINLASFDLQVVVAGWMDWPDLREYPEWIDDLVNSHPHIALPNIKLSIKGQWIASQLGRSDFLYRYARPDVTIQPAIDGLTIFTNF